MDFSAAAEAATVAGVGVAAAASVVAAASLRTQARSHRLEAITKTNTMWLNVGAAAPPDAEIVLSPSTVGAVRRLYGEIGGPAVSVLQNDRPPEQVAQSAPFVVGALFPAGLRDKGMAPNDEESYLTMLRARTLAYGYVRAVLDKPADRPQWLSADAVGQVRHDLAALDAAMVTWVNRMNEVAELYDDELLDRRRFVGKRSGAIIRQMFVAEPHILWRNSTTSGRWGLRLLGLGVEARMYHWRSPLQRAALALAKDPTGYGPVGDYPGFAASAGWIIGPGEMPEGTAAENRAERRLRRRLGDGYSGKSKRRQNDFVATLPRDPESGLRAGAMTWRDVARSPEVVAEAIAALRPNRPRDD